MDNNKKAITGVKKRQQIKEANKMTFVWIAIASIAVVLCLVISQFLVRQLWFNQKVINERSNTQSTLDKNLKNYEELKKSVGKLLANEQLNLPEVKANPDDKALKIVLDALPVTNDGTVLGSSLLQVILPKSGVSVSEMRSGADSLAGVVVEDLGNSIPFSFIVNSNYSQSENMLKDIERSIRPISVTELIMQGDDAKLTVEVKGVSYFSPEKSVELKSKVVSP